MRPGGEFIDSIRPGLDVSVTRAPMGVVGLILPWNFPIAIPAWKGWMFDQTRSFNASTLVRRYVNNPGLEFVKRMRSEECKITVYTCRYPPIIY